MAAPSRASYIVTYLKVEDLYVLLSHIYDNIKIVDNTEL
jgi:hypothetical protein